MPSAADFLAFTVVGLVIGSAYAIAASGLVITYATSNVFNMAHGAVGMVMAFLYWELAVSRGLPAPLAIVVVVGIIAPLFGALIERTMMRRMTDAPPVVSLTVTVGLFVGLIGLAQSVWPPTGRRVEEFFPGTGFNIGEVFVSGHDILTFGVALLVAAALYVLLARTRTGIGMRAVVDNRALLALHGARPGLLSMFSWALGSALAALAGILLVPRVELDYTTLTLLVVNAYAAAMVGRLKNLPRTIIGALILGLLESYFQMVTSLPALSDLSQSTVGLLNGLFASLPTVFLFIVMLLLPLEKLRVGTVAGASLVRVPSWTRSFISAIVLLIVVGGLSMALDTTDVAALGQALATACIMLSLVLLTGYGGEVSLGQMAFVGVGALVVAKFGEANLVTLLLAGGVTAGIGALIAIPALRLRGLYLGLGTLAFAVAMDEMVFKNADIGFATGGSTTVARSSFLGLSLQSEQAFTIAVALGFIALAFAVLALRRGRFGRLVLASRDSPAACGTLGLNITATRVLLFAIAAGLAGVAGALYAGMYVDVGADKFQMFRSLPLLLLAVVGGITSVTGALIGGVMLGLLPILQERFPSLGGAAYLLVGVAAIGLGRNPNGLAGMLFMLGRRVMPGKARDNEVAEEDTERVPQTADEEEVAVVATP